MKATYNDFLLANPNCSKFASNPDAITLFDLLNEDSNIIKMIDFAERGKPALAGCVFEVETVFDGLQNPTIDLRDSFTRTVVGRMVKAVLEPFGYLPTVQKSFPKGSATKYFSSASCYKLIGPATMCVVKRIEEKK